jgi:sugar (pentulose or hexulose) kinase
LIDEDHRTIASGSYEWENQLLDGIWTYDLKEIWKGLQSCYQNLCQDVKERYGTGVKTLAAIGISAMMHGYMVFDREDQLIVPFRTWRNAMTAEASKALTELFQYNIPQRWSIAHLYQAILNEEEGVKDIAFQTTLAGYVHWLLTGRKVLGVGDASGMFPIDPATGNYNSDMIDQFDALIADKKFPWKLTDILPEVLMAGAEAGTLTEEAAAFLDPSGELEPGIPFCPPEGDAGTGMVATNSVKKRTGNVSAGTSVFSMVVLEKELSKVYPELDLVTTPDGAEVAMVHCNNCTSDLNAWVGIFREFAECFGIDADSNRLYGTLYRKAMEGDADGGKLLAYNYVSGENITGLEEGRPLFVRTPDSSFNLANFMRTHLYTSLGALKLGMDILLKEEKIAVDRLYGHGGLFKTEGVGQQILADAMNTPITVMETAGEGGAWGIAVLAAYMVANRGEALEDYLHDRVFAGQEGSELLPDSDGVKGFDRFIETYKAGLPIERAAVDAMR